MQQIKLLYTLITYGNSGHDWEEKSGKKMPVEAVAMSKTAKALCKRLWADATDLQKTVCKAIPNNFRAQVDGTISGLVLGVDLGQTAGKPTR